MNSNFLIFILCLSSVSAWASCPDDWTQSQCDEHHRRQSQSVAPAASQAAQGTPPPAQTQQAGATQGQSAEEVRQLLNEQRWDTQYQNAIRERHQGVHNRAQNCYNRMTAERQILSNPASPQPMQERARLYMQSQEFRICRSLEIAADITGEGLLAPREANPPTSSDGRIACSRPAGYTLDFQSCKSAVQLYNAVVTADAALDLTQQIRADQSTSKLNREVAQRMQEGDAQNAAYDATISHNRNLSAMNTQKAMAYTAAVAALGSKLHSWQSKSNSALQRLCGGDPSQAQQSQNNQQQTGSARVQGEPEIPCPQALPSIKNGSDVFANDGAKSQLVAALMQYVQKAIAAGIASKNLGDLAKKVEQAKQGTEEETPAMFERCAISPNDPACMTAGGRTPGESFQPGDFSVGDGFGNNSFSPVTEDGLTPLEEPTVGPDTPQVGDIGSPFVEDAKKANDILNPAPAANVQPTGGAGGGGGGGGGGLGGGGVSLGNDLQGADAGKNKEAEIKSNKVAGNYQYGATGFTAVKPMKDEPNPFANLFDGKSKGGIEEDRTIASDDIAGKDSGLFLKISKRYNKVHQAKRIEANNLE